jgi:uncharacterized membrane protein YfcA
MKSRWLLPSLAMLATFIAAFILFVFFPDPMAVLSANWPILPAAVVAAFIANATALGGGFLFFPLFTIVYGMAPLAALKLSLSTQAFGMSAGTLGWSRSWICGPALLVAGAAGALGMLAGTFAIPLAGASIKFVFGWLSLLICVMIVLETLLMQASNNQTIDLSFSPKALGLFISAFFGGLVTAWTAIGIGEFVALYLLFFYRLKFEVAIGTGVAVLALCSIVGLLSHSVLGGIPWEYLLFTVPGVLVGGFLGGRFGRRVDGLFLPSKTHLVDGSPAPSKPILKYIFIVIILVNAVTILTLHYTQP